MVLVTGVIRQCNKVLGYRLRYDNGYEEEIDKEDLKERIMYNEIQVKNLTLTRDGKLRLKKK